MREMVFRIFGLELLIHARKTEFRVRDRIYLDFGMFICKFWVVTRESSCFARQADICYFHPILHHVTRLSSTNSLNLLLR